MRRSCAFLLGVLLLTAPSAVAQATGTLQIHYLNVGQGAGAVVISPRGMVVLFDLGVRGQCSGPQSYLQGLGVTRIDYVVVSHYHSDHIGCAETLLRAFPLAGFAYDRGGSYASVAFDEYAVAVGSRRRTASRGQRLVLDGPQNAGGPPVFIDFVALNGNGIGTTDEDDLGLVSVLRFGDFDAEFGGDVGGTGTGMVDPDPEGARAQTLTTTIVGDGTVTSSPSGISCPGVCSRPFAAGTAVTLTAAVRTGSVFTGWSGSCSGTGACTVTMSTVRAVTATFGCVWCPGRTRPEGASWLTDAAPSDALVWAASYADIETSVAANVNQVEAYAVHDHGSRYSSNETWVELLRPMVGLLSVGAANTDGLPSAEALGRLHAVGTKLYWTTAGNGVAPSPQWDLIGGHIVIEVGLAARVFTVTSAAGTQTYPLWSGGGTPIGDVTLDADADTLPDEWEWRVGLDPGSATGGNGTWGDPDLDGATNAQEYVAGTHPLGTHTRWLAEGATSAFFDLRFAVLNPGESPAHTWFKFLKADGTSQTHALTVGPLSRVTLNPKSLSGMQAAEFSTLVESDQPVVVDRTMSWDATGYGSHAETSVGAPQTTWYLAEGATHSGFNLFYLVQNPNSTPVGLDVKYLLPSGAPITKHYEVPASSRFNIWVNFEGPALASTDVSAVITSTLPTVVDRAMYLDNGGQSFGAGHSSVAVAQPSTEWFLAEGATGSYFDLFVLIANPNPDAAAVTATFLLPSGESVTKAYTVTAESRFNIWVDLEDPKLANTAVSTIVTSTNGVPIIVERAMWWPGTGWFEAHNSAGLTETGARWALADGEVGGPRSTETYILIANRGTADTARVTLFYENGTTESKDFSLPPTSRTNVAVGAEFPNASGLRFGAMVESIGSVTPQIAVERAMYSNAGGVSWAAGTDAVATKLR